MRNVHSFTKGYVNTVFTKDRIYEALDYFQNGLHCKNLKLPLIAFSVISLFILKLPLFLLLLFQ